jgi:hypothetical protein
MLMPLLALFQKIGIAPDIAKQVDEVCAVLERQLEILGESAPLDSNPAKQLARILQGRLTVIYGAGVMGAVARRGLRSFQRRCRSVTRQPQSF